MNKIRFYSIDALRFFAFFKVFLLHLPIAGNFPIYAYLKSGGGIGVYFFFVLSGFLITYLLVFEKQSSNTINFKRFLVRRSLRIWPLFFLWVGIVFLLPYSFKENIGLHLNSGGYELNWASFFFMENYLMLIHDSFPRTTPLSVFWSLCIEEHFYIFWLISLFFIPIKHLFKFLLATIILAWVCRIVEPMVFNNQLISTNDVFTNLDLFAIGGILGYFTVVNYKGISEFIKKIPLFYQWFVVVMSLVMVVFQNDILPYLPHSVFNIFRPTIIAIVFTILLVLFVSNDSKIKIKNKIFNYLGTISYGLYVYHIVVIHVLIHFSSQLQIHLDSAINLWIFAITSLMLSIGISSLSYHFFELPFLKFREKNFNQ